MIRPKWLYSKFHYIRSEGHILWIRLSRRYVRIVTMRRTRILSSLNVQLPTHDTSLDSIRSVSLLSLFWRRIHKQTFFRRSAHSFNSCGWMENLTQLPWSRSNWMGSGRNRMENSWETIRNSDVMQREIEIDWFVHIFLFRLRCRRRRIFIHIFHEKNKKRKSNNMESMTATPVSS